MNKKIAVIGAGISGLVCAYELQRAGNTVVVFEKNDHVGGRMASRIKDGFIFDIGADHLCDLYDAIKAYCTEFGIPWEKMRFLKYGIFRSGKVLAMKDAISTFSKMRMAMQYLLTPDVHDFFDLNNFVDHDKDNAYAFMKRRAGKEVSDYFVDAFTSTYQFHRAEEISVGALFGIMRSIRQDQARWDLHRTVGGMQALPDAFASHLDVRLNHPVAEVIGGNQVVVDGETFDAVVIASQATQTKTFYKNPTEHQRDLLDQSHYAATISVAFRVDRKKLPDTAIVWVPFVESNQISGYVNEAMKGDELVHDGKSLISTWLHEAFAKTLMEKTDEEIFAAVKQELTRVCPWFDGTQDLESFDLQRWPEAMPKFSHGHLTRVKTFMDSTGQGANHVFLCGDYLNSPWTEGALRCGQRVAKQVCLSIERS